MTSGRVYPTKPRFRFQYGRDVNKANTTSLSVTKHSSLYKDFYIGFFGTRERVSALGQAHPRGFLLEGCGLPLMKDKMHKTIECSLCPLMRDQNVAYSQVAVSPMMYGKS